MFILSFVRAMSMGDKIAALGFFLALMSFFFTWWRYQVDQLQQRAAQTRQELQAIIGNCNRFLRPLSEDPPYPVIHTVTTITKELGSRVGKCSCRKDAVALLGDEMFLRSICVEGWISSTQVVHMLDIVEEVEHIASSHNLQGELRLICDASFLLTGLVAVVCSPETFYKMLRQEVKERNLQQQMPQFGLEDELADFLDSMNVILIRSVCEKFDKDYKETIKLNLYFIAIAAHAFMKLKDRKLMNLIKSQDIYLSEKKNSSKGIEATIKAIEENASLPRRIEQVKTHLDEVRKHFKKNEYTDLNNLINSIEINCKWFLNEKDCSCMKVEIPLNRQQFSGQPQHILN